MRHTLRQLEYFVATCEAGSVTEPAHAIPVAQSSVSAAIGQLEAALGVQLFIRHHAQGVSPTPAHRRLSTVGIAGAPRPMRLDVAGLAAARPTRLVSAFVEHCRRLAAESGVPGPQHDG